MVVIQLHPTKFMLQVQHASLAKNYMLNPFTKDHSFRVQCSGFYAAYKVK